MMVQGTIVSLFEAREDCCGCAACAAICPKKAIEFKQDDEGFSYPEIDREKCVGCRLCRKVCSFGLDLEKAAGIEGGKTS